MSDFKQKLKFLLDDFQPKPAKEEKEKKFQTINFNDSEEGNKKEGLFNFGINSFQFYRSKNQPRHKSTYSIDFNSTRTTTTTHDPQSTVRSSKNSPNRDQSFFSTEYFSSNGNKNNKETINSTSRLNETNRLKKNNFFRSEVKSTTEKKFRKDMEEFSKNLLPKEGRSYINKPMINFQAPNLNINSKSYLALSPTHTRAKTIIVSNLNFSRDVSSNFNTNSINTRNNKVKVNNPASYFDKKEKKDRDLEDFFNDFKTTKKNIHAADKYRKY